MPKALKVVVCIVAILVALYCGMNMLMWGVPFPLARVDRLDNPQQVILWDEQGLVLHGGKKVMPKGMTKLPKDSKTIEAVTKDGVEITPDGKVLGLVQLWHWCGNDPLRYDVRKIDLAQLLTFHHEGESALKPYRYSETPFSISRHGWSVSGYTRMRMAFDPKYAWLYEPVR